MRISELSRRSGAPVATIKYYLRERLLPPGETTAANQAEYGEHHLRRLRLIRALVGVRGLSVSAAKEVLSGVSEHATDMHQMLGLVLGAVPAGKGEAEPAPEARAEVDELLAAAGWKVTEDAPAKRVIAENLSTLRSLGVEVDWHTLLPYARLAHETAVLDLDQLRHTDDPLEQAERALVLTVLLEPVLMALRRLAQEDESARRHGV
ncbi:MerR family transcriptional regulator [Streptomyces sp. TRM 70351]|uniref:MerR family transcriptional regulator n=1 Tax=Streptomyces sp. TRM 70351 TaxID=3116552 RepID=UPI002E7BFF4B|nr:MerR family transcriptional regulator [Streptomyces sp. TRM 70351]MEE1931394.1 MerR family transcriptional regulator [Streptomyces sp. TRM 70351]